MFLLLLIITLQKRATYVCERPHTSIQRFFVVFGEKSRESPAYRGEQNRRVRHQRFPAIAPSCVSRPPQNLEESWRMRGGYCFIFSENRHEKRNAPSKTGRVLLCQNLLLYKQIKQVTFHQRRSSELRTSLFPQPCRTSSVSRTLALPALRPRMSALPQQIRGRSSP